MKKKINNLLFLLLLVASALLYSQEAGFIPPSPQSFSFVKAGSEVSENEHRGSVNVNVPLFNFAAGKLSTDINLIYSGAGVKVDDLPNDAGMTWVLDAGGVITRTVNGLIDETATMRLNKTEDQIKQTTFSDCAADYEILTACYTPVQIDTERDIFDFRFAGVSGSFYLDANFLPVFLKNDSDVRIKNILPYEVTNNRLFNGFEITTKEGLVYIFGSGEDYQETTASKAMPANPPGDYAVTSYFLKEIRHQNSEKIIFSYNNTPFVKSSISEIHYRYLFPVGAPTGIMQEIDPELKTSIQTHYTRNKKRLQQISSNVNRDMINFIYSQKANSEFGTYLSQVEYSSGGSILKKASLDYLFENRDHIERFYLSAVNFYNKNVFDRKYQFRYDHIEWLPNRLSYSQDMYGYFNAKGGGSLIARYFGTPVPAEFSLYPNVLSSFGDRSPDFVFASKGTLTEVIYPTGGKTTFEYEMPKTKVMRTEQKILYLQNGNNTAIVDGALNPALDFVLTTYSAGQSQHHMKQAKFTVEELETGVIIHSDSKIYGYAPVDSAQSTVSLDANKKYLIKFSSTWSTADLKFRLRYRETVDWLGLRLKSTTASENGQPSDYKRFYYRSADLYTLNEEDLQAIDATIIPNVHTATFDEMHINEMGVTESYAITYKVHSSSNTSELYNSRSRSRYKNVTCSLGGDHFENGGYQKTFRQDSEDNLSRIRPSSAGGGGTGSPSAGHGFYNTTQGWPNLYAYLLTIVYFPSKGNRLSFSGGLENIRYFGKRNGAIFKTKQTKYQNRYNILDTQTNLFVSKVFDDRVLASCPAGEVLRIANFYIATYKNYTVDTKLEKEITTEYTDGVPLHIYPTYADFVNAQPNVDSLEASYRKLVTTVDYSYSGMPAHNQLTKQTVESPDKSILETSYQYAHEKNNQKLLAAHMIGIPLETKVVQKQNSLDAGKMILRSGTTYPDQNNPPTADTGNLLVNLSGISYDIQNNISATEIRYDKYDEKGNLLQYTGKDGIPVTILWGYNKTLPIAKVVGVTYARLIGYGPINIPEIIASSDKDADPALYNLQPEDAESQLTSKLEVLRTYSLLADYQITTYTYDPQIEVRSITPPSGIRQNYIYDSAGRLEKVIDINGKVLKEYKYNYKN